MTRTREPPRHRDHAQSCPCYALGTPHDRCTCGVTTPRKSKRPAVAEATEKALAVDSAELEAESKGLNQRAVMEAAIMGTGTVEQWRARMRREALERAAPDRVGQFGESPLQPGDVPRAGDRDVRLREIRAGLESILCRPIDVTQVVGQFRESFTVTQRCPACRADIVSKAPVTAPLDEHSTILHVGECGKAARVAYVKHRCEPVDRDAGLAGWSRAELEGLAQELENDGTEMVKRSIEVLALAKERKS